MIRSNIVAASLGAGLLVGAACNDGSTTAARGDEQQAPATEVGDQMQEAVGMAAESSKDERSAFMQTMQHRLSQLEAKVTELKATAQARKASLDAEARALMDALDGKLKTARERLTAARTDSGRAWEDIESGIGDAVDELEQAFERASSRFEPPT